MHLTAKVSEQVNWKCSLATRFYSLQSLHQPYFVYFYILQVVYISLPCSRDHFLYIAMNMGEYCYWADH